MQGDFLDKYINHNVKMHNAHDFLNFVKKHNKNNQSLQKIRSLQNKNKILFSSILEVKNSKSKIFDMKMNKYESLKSNQRYKHLKDQFQSNKYDLMNEKKQMMQRKGQEIRQSIGRQRQRMSDIIYNSCQLKGIASNYNKSQLKQKIKKKIHKNQEQSQVYNVKLPKISQSLNDIFTINYEKHENNDVDQDDQLKSFNKIDRSVSLISKLPNGYRNNQVSKKKYLFGDKMLQKQYGVQILSIYSSDKDLNIGQRDNFQCQSQEISQKIFRDKEFFKIQKRILETSENLSNDRKNQLSIYQVDQNQNTIDPWEGIEEKDILIVKQAQQYQKQSMFSKQNQDTALMNQNIGVVKQQKNQKQNRIITKRQKKLIFDSNTEKQTTFYDIKMNLYRQFIFMINLCHLKFDPIVLKQSSILKSQQKYKYYIGPGNNSLLVKELFSRRFWWIQEDSYKNSNCVWTQIKINQFYSQQTSCTKVLQYKTEDIENNKLKKKTKIQQKIPQKNIYKAPLPCDKDKIFTEYDDKIYESYQKNITTVQQSQKMLKFTNRLKYFEPQLLSNTKQQKNLLKMHNHLEFNHFIGNKKALFYNLRAYYKLINKNVFEIIPLTFHIKNNPKDIQYQQFMSEFKKFQAIKNVKKNKKQEKEDQVIKKKVKNIWIVKPGQLSNRGNGIAVITKLSELNNILKSKQKHKDGNQKTYIVQKYIQNPLLYKGRKFDIRHYMIITKLHGIMRVYWYGQGYIRTSSYNFDLQDGDQMIHLTNDAIQKNSTFYGKHQEGNKLSYSQFQKYLDGKYGQGKYSFAQNFYPKMKSIATDAIKSCFHLLDPHSLQHNFQIFGLDFMIDDQFNVWLIQVNTNPCLQLSSKLLARIIPNMLQHAFRLSVDVIFPPPCHYPNSVKYLVPDHPLDRLMYELIFDSARDAKELNQLGKNSQEIDYGGQIKEDDETYENQGKQLQLNIQ